MAIKIFQDCASGEFVQKKKREIEMFTYIDGENHRVGVLQIAVVLAGLLRSFSYVTSLEKDGF